MKKFWRLWALALGRKEGSSDKDADRVAFFRTIILLQAIITNMFIISGVIRHWDDVPLNNYNTSSKLWQSPRVQNDTNIT